VLSSDKDIYTLKNGIKWVLENKKLVHQRMLDYVLAYSLIRQNKNTVGIYSFISIFKIADSHFEIQFQVLDLLSILIHLLAV
jgi:hypothetical protein